MSQARIVITTIWVGAGAGIVSYVADPVIRNPFLLGAFLQSAIFLISLGLIFRFGSGLSEAPSLLQWILAGTAAFGLFAAAEFLSYNLWSSTDAEIQNRLVPLGALIGGGFVVACRFLIRRWNFPMATGILIVSSFYIVALNAVASELLARFVLASWMCIVVVCGGLWVKSSEFLLQRPRQSMP